MPKDSAVRNSICVRVDETYANILCTSYVLSWYQQSTNFVDILYVWTLRTRILLSENVVELCSY